MRSVLVTGTSSGFGLVTAVELARRGWRVFATMRDLDRRAALDSAVGAAELASRVEVRALDVTDGDSVQRAVDAVLVDTGGALDAVVNNAGIATGGAFEDLADDDVRRVMETNFFGVLAVTRAVVPAMRAQRHGRIVVVSSDSAFGGEPAMSAYCASKWAVEGWAESVEYELGPFGVHVVLVEPGAYRTGIWDAATRVRPETGPYRRMGDLLEQFVDEQVVPHARDPREVATVIGRALDAARPRFRYQVGPDARVRWAARGVVPTGLQRRAVERLAGLHRLRP